MAMAFKLHPVARAALTSGSIMYCADVVCQKLQARNVPDHKVDWARATRFGVVGLTLHGPFFHWAFGKLDRVFGPSQSLKTAVSKTALGQVTVFPAYVTAFFVYMSVLEGKGVQGGVDKLQANFAHTYASGSVFWPVANVINFMYCPPSQRVLYANACGLLWNTFLSWVNSRSGRKGEAVHEP